MVVVVMVVWYCILLANTDVASPKPIDLLDSGRLSKYCTTHYHAHLHFFIGIQLGHLFFTFNFFFFSFFFAGAPDQP